MPVTPANSFKGRGDPVGRALVSAISAGLRARGRDAGCRLHLRHTNKSYRIDETYVRIKGGDRYLYRGVDSAGQTIEFLLTAKRDTAAAKRFLLKAIEASGKWDATGH